LRVKGEELRKQLFAVEANNRAIDSSYHLLAAVGENAAPSNGIGQP
jgi:hypothetical protein